MKKRLTLSLTIALALLITPLQLQAKSAIKNKRPCAKYDRKIDAIKQKMRHGYTIQKGEYYKQKLVELQDQRVICEKKAKKNKKQNKKRKFNR